MATPDSTIESEYRAAVEFARNCLKVLGILDRDDLDPDDEAILRIAILIDNVPVILPRDPGAQVAVTLARRYRRGRNADDLDTLIEKADDHWSYWVALEVIWTWVWATRPGDTPGFGYKDQEPAGREAEAEQVKERRSDTEPSGWDGGRSNGERNYPICREAGQRVRGDPRHHA